MMQLAELRREVNELAAQGEDSEAISAYIEGRLSVILPELNRWTKRRRVRSLLRRRTAKRS